MVSFWVVNVFETLFLLFSQFLCSKKIQPEMQILQKKKYGGVCKQIWGDKIVFGYILDCFYSFVF